MLTMSSNSRTIQPLILRASQIGNTDRSKDKINHVPELGLLSYD